MESRQGFITWDNLANAQDATDLATSRRTVTTTRPLGLSSFTGSEKQDSMTMPCSEPGLTTNEMPINDVDLLCLLMSRVQIKERSAPATTERRPISEIIYAPRTHVAGLNPTTVSEDPGVDPLPDATMRSPGGTMSPDTVMTTTPPDVTTLTLPGTAMVTRPLGQGGAIKPQREDDQNQWTLKNRPGSDQSSSNQITRRGTDPRTPNPASTHQKILKEDSNIVVSFWNCASGLFNKLEFLKILIKDTNSDIIFISECNLKNKDLAKACTLDGFELELSTTDDARVCCYIKSGLNYTRKLELERGLEILIIDLLASKHRLLGFYKPFKIPSNHTKPTYYAALLDAISEASRCKSFIGGGDMNVNLNKISLEQDQLIKWLMENCLTQLVKENTRFRIVNTEKGDRHDASLIDHVYSNLNQKLKIQLTHTGVSDHECLSLILPNSRPFATKKVSVRDWRSYSENALESFICREIENLQLTEFNFEKAAKNGLDALAPFRIVRIRVDSGHIISTRVEKLKKKRGRKFKKFKKTNKRHYYEESKYLSKLIKKEIMIEKKLSTQKKAQSKNPKTFWQMV